MVFVNCLKNKVVLVEWLLSVNRCDIYIVIEFEIFICCDVWMLC